MCSILCVCNLFFFYLVCLQFIGDAATATTNYGTLISLACIGVGSSGLGESSSPCGRIRTTDRLTSSSRCGMYNPDGPE